MWLCCRCPFSSSLVGRVRRVVLFGKLICPGIPPFGLRGVFFSSLVSYVMLLFFLQFFFILPLFFPVFFLLLPSPLFPPYSRCSWVPVRGRRRGKDAYLPTVSTLARMESENAMRGSNGPCRPCTSGVHSYSRPFRDEETVLPHPHHRTFYPSPVSAGSVWSAAIGAVQVTC
ncbi:hypothetical protein F4861DRAFT_176898 [Xylaria intraflava]|nr:hypothetical protein F4861DRAFT_176898 [Xylaria intraflava]